MFRVRVAVAARRRAVAAVVAAFFVAWCPASLAGPVQAAARPASAHGGPLPGAQVGFAAGETDTQCLARDPSFCPRNTANYTSSLWGVLRATHAALYMNIEYMADFG